MLASSFKDLEEKLEDLKEPDGEKDHDTPGGEVLRPREGQEAKYVGRRSRSWLETELGGECSLMPYDPHRSHRIYYILYVDRVG